MSSQLHEGGPPSTVGLCLRLRSSMVRLKVFQKASSEAACSERPQRSLRLDRLTTLPAILVLSFAVLVWDSAFELSLSLQAAPLTSLLALWVSWRPQTW